MFFNLFNRKNDDTYELTTLIKDLELQIKCLKTDRQAAKDELADVKHQKKIEEEDIKHMVKLKEERLEIKAEKQKLEMEREKDTEIAKVKDEYRDKMEKQLSEETKNIKSMYGEVLERLPNVNVRLNGDV